GQRPGTHEPGALPTTRIAHGPSHTRGQAWLGRKIRDAVLDPGPDRLKSRVRLLAPRAVLEVSFHFQARHQVELAVGVAVDQCLNLLTVQFISPGPRSRPGFDAVALGHARGET